MIKEVGYEMEQETVFFQCVRMSLETKNTDQKKETSLNCRFSYITLT